MCLNFCFWVNVTEVPPCDIQKVTFRPFELDRVEAWSRKSVPSPHTDPACVEEVPTLPRGGDYRIQIGKYTFMGDCWKVDKDNFCLTLSWPMFARCSTPCFCGILRLFWIIHFFTSFLCLPLYSWSEGTLLSVLPVAWIFNSLCVPSLCRVCAYIIPTKSLKVSFCKRFSKHIM